MQPFETETEKKKTSYQPQTLELYFVCVWYNNASHDAMVRLGVLPVYPLPA